MYKKHVLIIIIFCTVVIACKRDNSDSRLNLHATVYDFYSNMPKPGVKVYLIECSMPSIIVSLRNWGEEFNGLYVYPYRFDSTITDYTGHFNFQFHPRFQSGYYTSPRYQVSDTNYFRVFHHVSEYCDESSKDSIYVDRKRFLSVKMQKINPVSSDDSIVQRIEILQPSAIGILEVIRDRTFIGVPPERKYYYSYPDCNKVVVEWSYFHPNLQGMGKDTFDLLPNGTNLVISY